MTQAYLYRWTEKSTDMWYIGSRSRKGCHPNDGYICSSKIVEPLIKQNKDNWIREILAIGEPEYIVKLETNYLKALNAKKDPMSYNKHNGDGKFTTANKTSTRKGQKLSETHIDNLSKSHKGLPSPKKGKKRSPESVEKSRQALLGKKQSPESNEKRRQTLSGRKQPAHLIEKRRQSLLGKTYKKRTLNEGN